LKIKDIIAFLIGSVYIDIVIGYPTVIAQDQCLLGRFAIMEELLYIVK